MKSKTQRIQETNNRIDEYLNTVYAIIGFLNICKRELEEAGKNVVMFQGRKLYLDETNSVFITPDLGFVSSDGTGLIGEVKYSFPQDQELWKSTFSQIKKYDRIVKGWPTNNNLVDSYDVVLLVHQARSRAVVDHYLKKISQDEKLNRAFAIVEFNRSTQGKEYFHFRLENGSLSHASVQEKLYQGIEFPFEIFLAKYTTVKIHDVPPPIPLMLHMIYECILDKIKGKGTYKKITKKTKIPVETNSKELTHILREVYSFKSLQSSKFNQGQREFPKQDWVSAALDKLAEMGDGYWTNKDKGNFTYILSAKEGNILDYYIHKCLEEEAIQQNLFSNY